MINNESELRSKISTLDQNLRSKILTLEPGKYSKYLPYAFTEQGIYMLMTVLRGELAVKQSKALIRIFKQMKDFIIQSQNVLSTPDLLKLSIQTTENTKEIQNLKQNMVTKNDFNFTSHGYKALSKNHWRFTEESYFGFIKKWQVYNPQFLKGLQPQHLLYIFPFQFILVGIFF